MRVREPLSLRAYRKNRSAPRPGLHTRVCIVHEIWPCRFLGRRQLYTLGRSCAEHLEYSHLHDVLGTWRGERDVRQLRGRFCFYRKATSIRGSKINKVAPAHRGSLNIPHCVAAVLCARESLHKRPHSATPADGTRPSASNYQSTLVLAADQSDNFPVYILSPCVSPARLHLVLSLCLPLPRVHEHMV